MPLPEHLGRIRINENEALLLVKLLRDARYKVLALRTAADNVGEDLHPYNRELHHIRKIWQEVSLLAQQKGWDIDEPGRENEEGSDPPAPAQPQKRVGGWHRIGHSTSRRIGGSSSAS